MFPRFREQIGTALDLIVEFSTLGEYRLAIPGEDRPVTPGAPGAPADAPGQAPRLGDAGGVPGAAGSAGCAGNPFAGRVVVRRTVAGGATGETPVATPAARRLPPTRGAAPACHRGRRRLIERHAGTRRETERDARTRRETERHAGARRDGSPPPAEQLCLAIQSPC